MSEKLNGQVLDLVPVSQATLAKREASTANQAFAGGIKEGGDFLPTLGLRGRQFRIKSGGQEVSLDNRTLDVILVTARPTLSKQYFAGKFEPGTVKKPDCQSVDGIKPDASVTNPINALCATCRMNAWGSRKNEQTGKDAKACNDTKLLVFAPPTLDGDKPLQCSLATGSQKTLAAYIKLLNHNGLAANEVVTTLSFTDDAFPKLEFKYKRNLTQDEAAKVLELAKRDDVISALAVTASAPAAEQVSAEQPTVVTPAPAAPTTTEAAPATATADQPSDDIKNVLSRWGAQPAT